MPTTLEHPRVLLCEGRSDAAFFTNLIRERRLPFLQIEFPTGENIAHGWQGFAEKLRAFKVTRGFESVTSILIVADNDSNPERAFANIQGQVQEAGGYPVPAEPMVPAVKQEFPSVTILMLPWAGEPGNLESACLEAVYLQHPAFRECIDGYCQCMGTNEWVDIAKISKMRLQAGIAALCRSDPATSLSYAWSRPEQLIPLRLACFDRIANFLQEFPAQPGV